MKKKVFLIPLAMFMVTGTVGLAGCDPIKREDTPVNPQTATLINIAVKSKPAKLTYNAGETFDSTGLVIEATYSDGSKKDVIGWTVDKNVLAAGDNVVTVTYTEGEVTKTTTIAITVNGSVDPTVKTLTGIAVTHLPDKARYVAGDEFDPAGLEVTASYSDNSSQVVTTGLSFDKTTLSLGDTEVVVSYSEGQVTKTAVIPITVADPDVDSLLKIEVTKEPTKTTYNVGDEFDSTGLEVTAYYTISEPHVVNATCSDPDMSSEGDKIVTVTYVEDGVTATTEFTITVEKGDVTTITPDHAMLLMDAAGEGNVVQGLQRVKGICASNTSYDSQYKQYTTGFNGISNFKLQFTDNDNILNGASPDGMEIVVEGYLEKYQGKYQLSYLPASASPTGEKFTPNLISAEAVHHEGVLESITVSESHREFYVGGAFVGETVTAHYSGGSTATVSASFSGYNMSAEGTQTVNVSYTEGDTTVTTSYTITVTERTLTTITPTEAIALMDAAGDGVVVSGLKQVKGICASNTSYDSQYKQYTTGFDGVSNFKLQFTDNDNILNGASPDGMEIVVEGYLEKYQGKYQLSYLPASASPTGEKFTPNLISAQPVQHEGVLESIEIVGSLTKSSYVEGQTYSAAGLSVKGHYDDGSEGTVAATITLNKTTAALGDTEIIASATFKEITAEPKKFTVTVTEKVPVVGGSVYTFKNDTTQAQNMGTWTSEQFMAHVEVDGGEIITGMKDVTNAYIGGNGGSGDATWNIWDSLKIGKSSAKGEITLLLDGTASFSKIKVSAIGARDDGTLTINEITQNVTKKAIKGDLEPIELEYEITGGITELKLSSKDAASNNYGIVITRIEFVGGSVPEPVAKLSSLELTTAPTKSSYYVGELFDAEGMVITAKYTNGGADKVLQSGDYSIDKTTLTLGDEYVVVSYTEDDVTKTVQVPITVTKAPVPVTGITLDQSTLSMHVLDADVQLVATVAPADADDKTVTWTVSEQGIVTVSNGLVHALAAGEVTVTAAAGDFSATCVVTVAAAEKVISGIAVATQPSKTTYVEGESFDPSGMTITVSYSSSHEPEIISSGFTYSTDPLTTGTNSVVITYYSFTANVSVTVTPAPVLDSISVANAEGKTNTYTEGAVISKDDLVVTAHYTQGKQDAVVTDYTISKTTALAVTDTSVTISYTEGGIEKTATYSFTVTKPTEPQIDVSNVDLYSIDAASLGLGSYADGTNTDLAWTMLCKGSSDTLQGNSSKSSELHNKIAFSKNITYIKFNVGYAAGDASTGSVRFGSSATPTGNDTSYGANTDLSLVTVGSFNVSAPAGCNYFSVVWTKGASYFSSIEIHFEEMGEQEQVAVQSVSLNKTSTSISVGSNETLVATVAPSNANDKSVTWSSSNSSVATVDSTGKVTGIAQGTATITVTTVDGSKTATCTVTVTSEGGGGGSETTSTPIDLGGDSEVVFGGVTYEKSIKAGTGKVAGSASISVPSDAKKLVVYIAGWNGESVKVSASGNGLTSKTLTLTSDSGVSGNGPTYTIGSTTESSFKFEIDVSSLTGGTLSLAATSGKRFVVWNASYTK